MSLHIVLASGNRGKLAEFSSLLGERFRFSAQSDLGVEEAEETGLSFIENALIKARNASLHTQLPALADDSGLCVNALGGAPGIYSARFAGSDADDSANNAKLIRELKGINDRRAHFHCALVFVRHAEDPAPIICEGRWPGEIVDDARGENGFGYDPHFYIPELGCCSAELPSQQKNRLSHRGRAVAQLIQRLQSEFPAS
ncbi:MAG: RdgB/HAM1 family non-canonical purine NTP pyrophosphatase [Spongiibacter sp.]|uniref:dITP/XTP pyrophosphatase n=1 Tax=Spongiibacter thalassae TaxID=2721624 RepID=A0ABX1GGY2_9GAMM|nr:RdgB/HAM1 family non-canonical purine NTP pyrophosphatase [Spongiibacter thalassae]MDX1506165.1 RdgB/HAM1 family non-canonical purine NTP pyrophosphatase [Spongiibacter sp.]NKI18469.1 RdgB/HAM1 family non-canonical purine NTP pyrophosphatase [Spongiibacter thalassae]